MDGQSVQPGPGHGEQGHAQQGNNGGGSGITNALPRPKKRTVHCKFFGGKNGCRAGDACPFIHDPAKLQSQNDAPQADPKPRARTKQQAAHVRGQQSRPKPPTISSSTSLLEGRRFKPPPVDGSRIVSKPVSKSQTEDPRSFQIAQLKRRFSPTEAAEDGGTTLAFRMVPSDPDFPFEMPGGLDCVLHVPSSYPKSDGRAYLEVRNQEMGAEYREGVEKGYARLIERMPQATLLSLMNALDRQLEGLLGGEKGVEVTIIPNQGPGMKVDSTKSTKPVQGPNPEKTIPIRKSKPPDTHTSEQLRLARERRDLETRQLEARLGRTSLFSKSPDGIAFTLPITPRKYEDLPVPLQAITSIKLFVPQMYPIQHCRVELQGVSRAAASLTEGAFERKAKESRETSLMGHVNFLAQNMHIMATEIIQSSPDAQEDDKDETPEDIEESALHDKVDTTEDDRQHIIIVPRPPEWIVADGDEGNESSETDFSDSYDSGDEDDDDGSTALKPSSEGPSTASPERGISLSFPSLELYSIELLELTSLSLTVKCTRCKDTVDVKTLRNAVPKVDSCKKCATALSITYRRDLMHTNSFRAGYLDLEGCTPLDMLPSTFIPTCSECSTPHPSPGVVSVRGDSTIAICRECHRQTTFKIPEVKFLLVSTTSTHKNLAPVRKQPKESLGIVAGQELPRRGRCTHYSKSYRWFRFGCCAKVFPCDRCHDAESDHPNEHANRMICGWCSREQNYRPEDCGMCRMSLVKKAGSGFWEGGKGTRDKARMSRKDPRKYKRRPGGVAKKIKAGGTGVVTGKA